jgi:hypothetical protein
MVLGPAERGDPFRCQTVPVAALRARDLAVGDVTNKCVAECIFDLSLDARATFAPQEFAALELE